MRSIFRYIASTRFTVVLLVLLVIGMFLGTLFPQGGTPEQYREAFGEDWYRILSAPGLLDVFHAPWFIGLGLLLLVNLLVGNIYALGIELKSRRKPPRGGMEIKVSTERIQKISEVFREMGFRCKQISDSFFVARKGVSQRLISISYHLCLALLAVGFLFTAMSRFDDMVYLSEGETKRIPFTEHDSLDVTLEKFDMEYVWLNGRYFPKDYKSTLVLSTGQRKTVEVNKPLKYRGLNIYQFEYQQKFDLVVGDTTLSVTATEPFSIPGINGEFTTGTVYLGTLFRDNEREAITPNTKLYFTGTPGVQPEKGGMRGIEIGKLIFGETLAYKNTTMEMQNVAEISGLFYRKDTGYPVVFYALILFMLGLFIRVLFPSYRLRVYVDKPEGAIYVAGKASGIASRLELVTERLKRTFGHMTSDQNRTLQRKVKCLSSPSTK